MGYTPPFFDYRKTGASEWTMYGSGLTTLDALKIMSNRVDTYPLIMLVGGNAVYLESGAGSYIRIYDESTEYFRTSYATPDAILQCPIDTKNIFLKTTGTGQVKFGTYTAGAATDSTGFITILDALGNTRKLMVQA